MSSLREVQEYVSRTVEMLQQFSPLINCHMVDFLTHDLWNAHIPNNIRDEVRAVGPEESYKYFTQAGLESSVSHSPILSFLKEAAFVSSLGKLNSDDLWPLLNRLGGIVDQVDPQLSMFMSPKKAHEVQVLSKVVTKVAKINDTGCIIDIGGGKGYLGFTLAHHYGQRVLSVDCAQANTHGALKLARNLKKWWETMQQKRYSRNVPSLDKMYKQVTTFIHPETNLEEIVHKQFQKDDLEPPGNLDKFCLVGLHACGDLTPSCLRLFCVNQNIRALCIVGCCYNLITDREGTATGEEGFPLSQYLKQKGFKLSRNARMLAAQSVERMAQEGKEPPISLWYRALLQVLLDERGDSTALQVGRSKAQISDFSEYVSKALTKLKLQQASRAQVDTVRLRHGNRRKLHDIFFMMRVILAPVIESLILLDRQLYLLEQDIKHTYLVRVFDSVISPRCCGIIAFKD